MMGASTRRIAALACAFASAFASVDALAQARPEPAPVRSGIVPPRLESIPDAPYPTGASGDALVVLIVTIGPDGRVTAASPEEENEPFSSQAVRAAMTWRFEPATRDGKPIAAKIRMEVSFHAPTEVEEEPEEEGSPAAPKAPPRPQPVEEVTVRGEHVEASRTVSLGRAEVRQIPGTFGDPFRAVEIMPGVTPIVSGLPFFFIRGAPPGDAGYFLDGIRVPLLFHVGAGPSVIQPGLVDRVDLYPGGYPARYGRFSGGIVAGETTPPATEAHGEYNVRLFDAGAMVEVPFANDRAAAMIGGRYSYTGLLFTLLSNDTILNYWDYQARVHYDLTDRDRVGVFAFGSYDFLGQRTQTDTLTLFGTDFHRVDLRYDRKIEGGGTMRVAGTLGLDESAVSEGRSVRDRIAGTRMELTLPLSKRALFRAGTDMQIDTYDVELGPADLSPSTASIASSFPSRSDLTIGTRADVVYKIDPRLEITPGMRVDFYGSDGATAVGLDPRFAMRTMLSDRTHVLSAMGIAHQAPSFAVPVPGFQPGGLHGGLQKAVQESLGVEFNLGGGTTATATVFHNGLFDMSDPLGSNPPQVNGCPPGQFPTDSLAGDRGGGTGGGGGGQCGKPRFTPGTIGPDRSGGGGQAADSNGGRQAAQAFEVRTTGNSYGLELFIKRKLTQRVGGFVSYTLSRSTRTYGTQEYIASFDRTHVGNAAAAYDLGRNWRFGTRFVFYTGLPKAPDPTDPGATRLPPFYRFDLRLEKKWQLGQKWWISFVAEWMNVTLHKEAVATRCTLKGCETQTIGPVTIPSIGVEGGF